MADKTENKNVKILLIESWNFFAKRWIVLFQITLFVWMPILVIVPLAGFLWSSYDSLMKNNPELLFSVKVILAGGVLSMTIAGLFVLALLMDKLVKVTLINTLWQKPEEKYYLDYFKLVKDVWPKIGGLFKTESVAWATIILWSFLLIAPGVLFLIWFSFVPYEMILKGKTGKTALNSSKAMIRNNIGKFTGNMLVMIFILIFINIGTSGFFKLIFSFSNSKTLLNLGEMIATIISNILSLWGTVFHFGLYIELEKQHLSKVPGPQPEIKAQV